MDTSVAIAIVTTLGSVATGVFAVTAASRTEKSKKSAEEQKGRLETVGVQVDLFKALLDEHIKEITRLRADRDRLEEELEEERNRKRDGRGQ